MMTITSGHCCRPLLSPAVVASRCQSSLSLCTMTTGRYPWSPSPIAVFCRLISAVTGDHWMWLSPITTWLKLVMRLSPFTYTAVGHTLSNSHNTTILNNKSSLKAYLKIKSSIYTHTNQHVAIWEDKNNITYCKAFCAVRGKSKPGGTDTDIDVRLLEYVKTGNSRWPSRRPDCALPTT